MRTGALGDLVFCGLQEGLADDEPVALAGHALRPAIEAGVFPSVMQRGFQRKLGGVCLDAVGLTCDRAWPRPSARARQAEAKPQDCHTRISILLDRAANQVAEA